jgi:hypothetical protein
MADDELSTSVLARNVAPVDETPLPTPSWTAADAHAL